MSKRNMVFVNPTAIAIFASLLCAAMCNGKTMYDDWENGPSDITEMKRPAFYAGSRYGRSQYGGSLGSSTNVRVAPRRDFHFLRYGKRTTEPIFDVNASPTIQCYENVRDYILTCSFTGVQDYYRCWKGQPNKFDALDKILPPSSASSSNNNMEKSNNNNNNNNSIL